MQLTIVLSGLNANIPLDMPPVTGLLVWRDTENFVAFWDGAEFVPTNRAGWGLRFHTAFPDIPVGGWAVITSPTLDITAGGYYRRLDAGYLMLALHQVEEFQPARAEKDAGLPDLSSGDPEFDEVRAEVDAFVHEQMEAPASTR